MVPNIPGLNYWQKQNEVLKFSSCTTFCMVIVPWYFYIKKYMFYLFIKSSKNYQGISPASSDRSYGAHTRTYTMSTEGLGYLILKGRPNIRIIVLEICPTKSLTTIILLWTCNRLLKHICHCVYGNISNGDCTAPQWDQRYLCIPY